MTRKEVTYTNKYHLQDAEYGDVDFIVNYGVSIFDEQLPYFFMTGEIRQHGARGEENYIVSGAIRHKIEEHLDEIEIAKFAKWHLTDFEGIPMHYAPNAKYWYQMHHGLVETTRYLNRTPADILKTHILYGTAESFDYQLEGLLQEYNLDSFMNFMQQRKIYMQRAFFKDMAELEPNLLVVAFESIAENWRNECDNRREYEEKFLKQKDKKNA